MSLEVAPNGFAQLAPPAPTPRFDRCCLRELQALRNHRNHDRGGDPRAKRAGPAAAQHSAPRWPCLLPPSSCDVPSKALSKSRRTCYLEQAAPSKKGGLRARPPRFEKPPTVRGQRLRRRSKPQQRLGFEVPATQARNQRPARPVEAAHST